MRQIVRLMVTLAVSSVLALAGIAGTSTPVSALSSCPTDLFAGLEPDQPNTNDSAAINVGLEFKVHGAPYISGIKFHKGVDNTGTHVAHLRQSGAVSDLASKTYTSETSSGWQTVYFDDPVPVSSAEDYIAWVSMPDGHYSVDTTAAYTLDDGFGSDEDVMYVESGNKALYDYTSNDSDVPTNTSAFNYGVSPIAIDSDQPVAATGMVAAGATAGPTVDWSTAGHDANSSTSSAAVKNIIYRSDGSTYDQIGSFDSNSAALDWKDRTGLAAQHDVTALPGTTYTYSLASTDACGNTAIGSASAITTDAQGLENLFGSMAPTSIDTVTSPITVGTHWQSVTGGNVWGARLYRGSATAPAARGANDGIKAMLWDNDGTLLASQWLPYGNAQDTWIDVRFDSPVAISANHDYVVGYYASNGQEAYMANVFDNAVYSGNLIAPADTEETPSSVYSQDETTSPTTFPTERSSDATWYGVDVNFFADEQ